MGVYYNSRKGKCGSTVSMEDDGNMHLQMNLKTKVKETKRLSCDQLVKPYRP